MQNNCTPLSQIHRGIHACSLRTARNFRQAGAEHARLMQTAKVAREYFARLRSIGC